MAKHTKTLVRTLLPPLACNREPPGVGGTALALRDASEKRKKSTGIYHVRTFFSSSSGVVARSLLSMTSRNILWLRELRSFQSVLAVRRLASPRWMTSRTDFKDVTTSSLSG